MLRNLIGADWVTVDRESLPVYNPATGAAIEQVPISGAKEVDSAVGAATAAFEVWSRTPLLERVRLTFRFKELLERDFENLAQIVTLHHGKTLDEARGEVRRGIEVVDFACGAPTLLQGRTLRSVSAGVDQDLYRYPVGVCCGIPPFNFPVMIPLWMFPLAVVAGNTFILKPSERTPLGAIRLAELFLEAGFPGGVLNLVHGAKDVVDALLENPGVSAVSFVGSEPVARRVYLEAARNGKRVQALGGAKNHMVVMPDAEVPESVAQLMNAGFGNAGERCLAGSVAVVVGKSADTFIDELARRTSELVVGPGDKPNVDVGPLIRAEHRKRVIGYIEQGASEGANVLVDGRKYADGPGFFLGPTILDRVTPSMTVGREEIFGPVLSVSRAATLDEAISITNSMDLGNMAVIFTQSGRTAREFRERVQAGMIGINVPVAQPFAFFPFSGWKRSFYGDLHVHGTDGIDFFTRKKTVISRW
jgi:malonate-semialdehyde dehydrogenase (acetylating)/methylmalonate-semialdehyde dehydrogenase